MRRLLDFMVTEVVARRSDIEPIIEEEKKEQLE